MRHRRWLELLKDHDMVVKYHLSMANMVAIALSRKFKSIIDSPLTNERRLSRELDALQTEVVLPGDKSYIAAL